MFGIGPLRIIIGGDSKDFDRTLAGVEARVAGFSRGLKGVVAGLGIAAAVAGVVSLTKESFKTIDAQAELAYRVGGTISAVQTLSAVGEKAGVTLEALGKAAGLMNMRLAEAARTGTGPAAEALRRIGLNAKDLIKLNVDERLAVIADRFKALGLTTGQQAEVLRSFGIRGQEMINLLEGGGDTIRQARKDLEAYGVALSTVDGAKVEAANDALADAKKALTGIANQVAVALSPLIGTVAGQFAEAGKAAGGFRNEIQSAVGVSIQLFGAFQREWFQARVEIDEGVADILNGINSIIDGWNSLGTIGGIWRALLNGLGNLWTGFIKSIGAGWEALKTAITSGDFSSLWKAEFSSLPDIALPQIARIEHSYGKLRSELATPASDEEWKAWWERRKKEWEEAARVAAEGQAKLRGRGGPAQDNLTGEQRKSLEQRFVHLQKALANEAAALDFWRAEEMLMLKEFEDKRIGTVAERNAVKLALDAKYQKDKGDLIWTKLEEEVATEQEILERKHAMQLKAINDFEAARTNTEINYGELRRKHAEKQALSILQLQTKQWAGLAGIVDTAMGHISQIVGKEGGAAFEVMKAISMATALVKGSEAVVSAWATGNATGIPGMGAVMAGITAAGVGAQIAAIARTKPEGAGGAVPTPAGGGEAAAAQGATPAAGPQQTLVVRGLSGNGIMSMLSARDLAKTLIDFQRDGGKVVLDS